MTQATTETADSTGSRHGFDFWQGTWRGLNRKLVNVLDPDCDEWIEFEGVCQARLVLGGLGSFDTLVTEMPGRGHFEGMTVRLYDPATDVWRIWWASTRDPGRLDTPAQGRFVDGVGRFLADDVLDGVSFTYRLEWTVNAPDSARWQQFFSFDGGQTWQLNWTCEHTRIG